MVDQLDQMQVSTVVTLLPALLEHPDFQEGMFHEDHEKAWIEDDIIQFVGEELSEKAYRRE